MSVIGPTPIWARHEFVEKTLFADRLWRGMIVPRKRGPVIGRFQFGAFAVARREIKQSRRSSRLAGPEWTRGFEFGRSVARRTPTVSTLVPIAAEFPREKRFCHADRSRETTGGDVKGTVWGSSSAPPIAIA